MDKVKPLLNTAALVLRLALAFAGIAYGQQSNAERLRLNPGSAVTLSQERNPQVIQTNSNVAGSAVGMAFGRYLAWLHERNPFTDGGPIAVEIEASLPSRGKRGHLLAIRQIGASERSEYLVLRVEGDSTVKQQVIARYLAAQEQAEALPYSSVAITPGNYRFRYASSIDTDGTIVYVFQITPKKKRVGLIQGELWIDSATGIGVRQVGVFVKRPSVFIRRIEILRDTNLDDRLPSVRVTHVSIETRMVGRAELTITERALVTADREAASHYEKGD
jgi:hypothetical protein